MLAPFCPLGRITPSWAQGLEGPQPKGVMLSTKMNLCTSSEDFYRILSDVVVPTNVSAHYIWRLAFKKVE